MKVIFFGLDSIGQRHASLLSGKHEPYAFRSRKGGIGDARWNHRIKTLYLWTVDQAIEWGKGDIVWQKT